MSLKTPLYDLRDFPDDVYEPSEDTFLLIDALEMEQEFLKGLQPDFAAEIGSGSGVVITSLSFVLQSNCAYFATDINIKACEATMRTATLNDGTNVNCLNTNLLDGLKKGIWDVLLFNAPYVPTDSNETEGFGLNRAWAGGVDGRQITDKVLLGLSDLLSPRGVCYVVLLKDNNIEEITALMRKLAFKTDIVLQRKIPGEHLFVLKFTRL